MTTNFQKLLETLQQHNVEFILIGGLAAVVHGSTTATADLDIVYNPTKNNIQKLVKAVVPLHVRLRGKNENIPFIFDEKTFSTSQNMTLMTDLGALDLFQNIPGFSSYEILKKNSESFVLFDVEVQVISIQALIENKQKTARPKDLQSVAELQEIQKLKS